MQRTGGGLSTVTEIKTKLQLAGFFGALGKGTGPGSLQPLRKRYPVRKDREQKLVAGRKQKRKYSQFGKRRILSVSEARVQEQQCPY